MTDATGTQTPPWPLTCKCGEAWTEGEWAELPSDGKYFAGADGWIEVRTCVCGARLVVACDAPPTPVEPG